MHGSRNNCSKPLAKDIVVTLQCRRLLATGWARNKQTVYAPIAAKMKFVTYDEQGLGQEANNKSSDCRAKIGDPSPGRAMNIEEIGDYNMLLQDALEMAITKWWRQVETEGIPTDLKYTEAMANAGKITKFVNVRLYSDDVHLELDGNGDLHLILDGQRKHRQCWMCGDTVPAHWKDTRCV
ncbi:hypothetical protein Y032_0272g960 [Ancylostoma ceylanicum]|uniref:SCP domain-containing protein n=1 Tax=Ancylostoma ceylanicum TaxID=53326 RepID=A0A016S8B0_9BILA|nr:hypothetical protein Y032_0272g960 [Ancylostoma ceylanicum]